MKQYFEIQPPKILEKYVVRYWVLDVINPTPNESVNKIIPEGLFEIVVNYKDDYFDKSNNGEKIPKSFVNGPFNKYRIFETKGDIGIFAIDFTPVGWHALTGYEGVEFTEKVIHTSLLNKTIKDFSARLIEASSNMERVKLCNSFLIKLVRKQNDFDFRMERVENEIKLNNGNVNIHELSKKHFCSVSKLERNFKKVIGLTPKKYAKLMRFRTILDLGLVKDWSDFVVDLGFYDQAHFIKEFKSYIGETPQKYFQTKQLRNKPLMPDKRSFD